MSDSLLEAAELLLPGDDIEGLYLHIPFCRKYITDLPGPALYGRYFPPHPYIHNKLLHLQSWKNLRQYD